MARSERLRQDMRRRLPDPEIDPVLLVRKDPHYLERIRPPTFSLRILQGRRIDG